MPNHTKLNLLAENTQQAREGNNNLFELDEAVVKNNIDACKELSTLTLTSLVIDGGVDTTKTNLVQSDEEARELVEPQSMFRLMFEHQVSGQSMAEPQSMFDRLMSEHYLSGQYFWQHELRAEKLISIFYESIWMNNLQPIREMQRLAVKSHGDKLFVLSPHGTLSSFDNRSSEVCWSIPIDFALDLCFSYKSSENNCSYFVDNSRVFMHTKGSKPVVDHEFGRCEVFEEVCTYLEEEILPSKSVTQIYVDPKRVAAFHL